MLTLPKLYAPGYSPVRVPTCPVEIDWSHPLAVGLQFYFLPGVRSDDLTHLSPSLTSLTSASITPGVLGSSVSSNGGYVSTPSSLAAGNGANLCGDITLFWCGVISSAAVGNTVGLISKTTSNVGNPFDYLLGVSSSTASQLYLVRGNGNFSGGYALYGGNPPAILNTKLTICTTSPAANTNAYSYVNGSYYGMSNSDGTPGVTPQNSNQNFYIGSRADGVTKLYGNVFTVSAYNRMLSLNEAQWLSAEPFIMLRPIMQRKFFLVGPAVSLAYTKSNFLLAS